MPDLNPPSATPAESKTPSAPLSVFSLGYIPTSTCAAFDFTGKSFFSVPPTTLEGMRQAGTSEQVVNGIAAANFWELIIERYAERHSEDYALHNTLSDSVAVCACGAAPVNVRISGQLLTADHTDHRLLFLSHYLERMRAKRNTDEKRRLSFSIKGVSFNLIIKSLAFADSVSRETYVHTEIEGWAFHYPTQSALYGYYGTAAPTPVNKEEAEGAARPPQQPADGAGEDAPEAKAGTGRDTDDEVRVISV